MFKIFLALILINFFSSAAVAQDAGPVNYFLHGTVVTGICGDNESIWISTNGQGIFMLDKKNNKFFNYSTSNGNLQHDFFYCIASNNRFAWAGSTDGLFIFDKRRNKWTKRKFGKGGQLSNWIRSLAYDKFEDVLWIGRFKYLTKFDIKNRRFYDYDLTVNQDEKTNTIKNIAVDGDSVVWFGTEAGLHKYYKSKDLSGPGATKFYNNRSNYFNGDGDAVSISSILIEQDFVWIGTDEFVTYEKPNYNIGGLYKFNRENEWIRFGSSDGLPGNGIYATEMTGNYIWVSLYKFNKDRKEGYGRGLALINRLNNRVKILNDENLPETIYTLYFDGEILWLGSDRGLYSISFANSLSVWNERK